MTMTIKKLKELLEQYPNDTLIYVYDSEYGTRDINSINIEYVSVDDYQLPQITLN